MNEHDKVRHPECKRCIDWIDSINDGWPAPFAILRSLSKVAGLCPHCSDSDCPELTVQTEVYELYRRAMEPPLLEGTGDKVTRRQHGYRST